MDEKDFRQAMKWYRRAPVTRVAPETGSLSAQPKKDVSQREKARVWFPRDLPACSSQTETDERYEENLDDNHSALTIYREKHVTPHSKTEKVEDAEVFNAPEIPLAETMTEDNPPYDVDYRMIRDDEGLLLELSDDQATQEKTQEDKTDSFSGMLASIETGLANMLAEKPRLRHPSRSFSSIDTCLAGILDESADQKISELEKEKEIDPEIAAELATLSEEELAEIAGFDLSLLRKDDADDESPLSQQDSDTELGKKALTEITNFDRSLSSEVENEAEIPEEDKALVPEKSEESLSEEKVDVSEEVFATSEVQSAIEVESETILSEQSELSELSEVADTEMALKTSTEQIAKLETVSETDLSKQESLFETTIDEEEVAEESVRDTSRLNRFIDSGEELIIHNPSEDEETVLETSFADRALADDEMATGSSVEITALDIAQEKTDLLEESGKTEGGPDEPELLSISETSIKEVSKEPSSEESDGVKASFVAADESPLFDEVHTTPIELSSDVAGMADVASKEEISSQETVLDEIREEPEQETEKTFQTKDDGQLDETSVADEIVESDDAISDDILSLEESSESLTEEIASEVDSEAISEFKDDLSPSEIEKSDISPVDAISQTDESIDFEVVSEETNQEAVEPELLPERLTGKTVSDTDTLLSPETDIAEDTEALEETVTEDDSVSEAGTETETEIEEVSQDEINQESVITVSGDEELEKEVTLSEEILSVENVPSTVVSEQSTESDIADEKQNLQAIETLDDVVTLTKPSDQVDQISESIPVLSVTSEENALSEEITSTELTVSPDPENALADSILLAEGENPPDFDVPVVPVFADESEKTEAPIPEEDVFREKMLSHQRNKMAFAEYKVAVAYARKNTEEARREMVKWYTRAAENGHAVSQFNLGNIFYAGRGVDKDYELAADWYEMAARQGVARAQDNLGLMYFHGRGRFVDTELAVYWFHQAALQGYAPAQYKLAMHLEAGVGIEPDLQEAMYWYQRAASQGDINAQKAVSRLEGNRDQ